MRNHVDGAPVSVCLVTGVEGGELAQGVARTIGKWLVVEMLRIYELNCVIEAASLLNKAYKGQSLGFLFT